MRKAILVLGMHRSGTSCLTGLLRDNGVHIGGYDVTKYNERIRVWRLNEMILNENGLKWNSHHVGNIKYSDWSRLERDKIIEEMDRECKDIYWAIKDPRLLLLLNFWLETIEDRVRLVGIFRNKKAVAESLRRRDGMPVEEGEKLWELYNKNLLYWKTWADDNLPLGMTLLRFDSPQFSEIAGKYLKALGLEGKTNYFDPLRIRCNGEGASELYEKLKELEFK